MLTAFLMVILLAGPAIADGQFKAIDFGIKGGINLTNLEMDPKLEVQDPPSEVDMENYLRFGGGVTLGLNVTPTFGLDLDVLYMMKGAKAEYTVINDDFGECTVKDYFELNYIVFKPMIRLAFVPHGTTPYILAGGEIGYLVSTANPYDWECQQQSGSDEEDLDNVTDFDFGVNFGAGLELAAGTTSIIIEGHYSLGLTNVYDAGEDDDSDQSIKTRGIYGFVGVRF